MASTGADSLDVLALCTYVLALQLLARVLNRGSR